MNIGNHWLKNKSSQVGLTGTSRSVWSWCQTGPWPFLIRLGVRIIFTYNMYAWPQLKPTIASWDGVQQPLPMSLFLTNVSKPPNVSKPDQCLYSTEVQNRRLESCVTFDAIINFVVLRPLFYKKVRGSPLKSLKHMPINFWTCSSMPS